MQISSWGCAGDGARAKVLRPGEGRRCYECQRGHESNEKARHLCGVTLAGVGRVSFTRPA